MKLNPIKRRVESDTSVAQPISDLEAEVGAKAVIALFSKWAITDAQACLLLGGMSGATYSRWKRREFGRIGTDLRTRLSVLLGIHKSLRILFSDNARVYDWVNQPNEVFEGNSAIEVMLHGQITDLFRVRHYLDTVRG